MGIVESDSLGLDKFESREIETQTQNNEKDKSHSWC